MGTPRQGVDWQTIIFIGYVWLRDDQYAAPKAAPYLGAMMTRPLDIKWAGNRALYRRVADSAASRLPQDCIPCLQKYASHRLSPA